MKINLEFLIVFVEILFFEIIIVDKNKNYAHRR